MCDNGFSSDLVFERYINKFKRRQKMYTDRDLNNMQLAELYSFKREIKAMMLKYSAIATEHDIIGYLEDLYDDVDYVIDLIETHEVS